MKWLLAILLLVFVGLQCRLWIGEGSIAALSALNAKIDRQRAANQQLRERNGLLAAEVEALRRGTDAIEERAREDLGMIKEGETFFMVIEPGSNDLAR